MTTRLLFCVVAAFLCSASTAHAQQLLNPATAVAGAESSFGQNAGKNPTSTASGIFQFINSTWQDNLRAIGGNPAAYPTASSAPPNLQFAVFANAYNTKGLADWTCNLCNPTFANSVREAGGESAYLPRGSLSINPADYESVNTPDGLQAYFNTNSGGSFVGAARMQQTPAGAAALASSTNASPTIAPFSYVYSLVIEQAAPAVSGSIGKVQDLVHPWLGIAVTVAVIIAGFAMALGRARIAHFNERVLRLFFVSVFAIPGSVAYSTYVEGVVLGVPALIGTAFGMGDVGAMAAFDHAIISLDVLSDAIIVTCPNTAGGWATALLVDLVLLFGVGCLLFLALPYIGTAFLMLLLLIIIPLAIPGALFRSLDNWVLGAANQLMTLVAMLVSISAVVSIYQKLISVMMAGFVATGNPNADVKAFIGITGVLFVMALTVYKYLPGMISRIFSGSAGIRLVEPVGAIRSATR